MPSSIYKGATYQSPRARHILTVFSRVVKYPLDIYGKGGVVEMNLKFSKSLYRLDRVCVCVCFCNERGNFLSAVNGGKAYSRITSVKSPSTFSAGLTNITILLPQSHILQLPRKQTNTGISTALIAEKYRTTRTQIGAISRRVTSA